MGGTCNDVSGGGRGSGGVAETPQREGARVPVEVWEGRPGCPSQDLRSSQGSRTRGEAAIKTQGGRLGRGGSPRGARVTAPHRAPRLEALAPGRGVPIRPGCENQRGLRPRKTKGRGTPRHSSEGPARGLTLASSLARSSSREERPTNKWQI